MPTIFVSSLREEVDRRTIGFVAPHIDLANAECMLRGATDVDALRESFGRMCYDDSVSATLTHLDQVNRECDESEKWAEPLRRKLQSRDRAQGEWAQEWLAARGLSKSDLCSAWHHLPRDRRAWLRENLCECEKAK